MKNQKKPGSSAVQSFVSKLNERKNRPQNNLKKATRNRFAASRKLEELRKKVSALEKKRISLLNELKKSNSRLEAEINDANNVKSFKDIMNNRRLDIQRIKEERSSIFKSRTRYSINYPA